MQVNFSIFLEYGPLVLRGFLVTIAVSGFALVAALILGAFIAIGRLSRNPAASYAARAYVELVRNLPFMVILFMMFYLLPSYGLRLPALIVGVIALSFYEAAYFSEIFRGAILSVPKGQMDSARATGMSRAQSYRHVIFPQMMGYFIPLATNQAVMVVKDSSVLSTITIVELTMSGQIVLGYTYSPLEPLMMVSILYWLVCSGISRLGAWLEVALQPFRPVPRGPHIKPA